MTGGRLSAVAHRHLGRWPYRDALALQLETRQAVWAGEPRETIFSLEHDPVITLGRRATADDILVPREALEARGVDVVEVDRGGEVTYHGPGQLVIYPVLAIGERRILVGDLVRNVAGAVADVLAELGIDAHYDGQNPGLWTASGAKICAVGMRIARGVSTHGAAVNVTTDLDAYGMIVPCGLPQSQTTSIASEGVVPPRIEALAGRIVARIGERLGVEIVSTESAADVS